MSPGARGRSDRIPRRALIVGGALAALSGSAMFASADAGVEPATSSAGDGGRNVLTTVTLIRVAVPDTVREVLTQGYASPGDGGGARWLRVAAPPAHGGYVRDAQGAIFELAEAVIRPEMFGARGGDEDDHAAIQQAVTMAAMTARRADFLQPRYSLAGQITIPGKTHRFALAGGAVTELVQLEDDCPIFHFLGGYCSHWRITGFRFAWKRDQGAARRRSYAACFSSDAATDGYWNFEISDCVVVNGFRGFGQPDDGAKRPPCPLWGGVFRRIAADLTLSGAAIALRTWGRAGQPNNRIEQFYARCDGMTEPAIILEAQELAVLTSVELNGGGGCQIQVDWSINVLIEGVRFEQVGIGPGDCYIGANGAITSVDIRNMSVQTMIVSARGHHPGGRGDRALIRFMSRAHGSLASFTDNPFRGAQAVRTEATARSVSLIRADPGSEYTLASKPKLVDPALTIDGGER